MADKNDDDAIEERRKSSVEIQAEGIKMKQQEAETGNLRSEAKYTEHEEALDTLLARLETSRSDGMTSALAAKRLETDGPNCLTPPAQIPEWLKFLHTQTGFFSLLLWFGAILCFIGFGLKKEQDNLYLGIVLSTVTLVTGIFEYIQESKSSQLMESFKDMMPTETTVYRDGEPKTINALDLVVGDVIDIRAGDKIPADVRVLQCTEDMRVDNSSLTGEPDPLPRSTQCTDKNPLETKNLAFFGTLCPRGKMTGLVVRTGDNTVMGRIAGLTTQTDNEQTPINKEITHFVFIVSGVAIFLGISFLIIGFALGTDPITNLVFMIGIIVANVPEGLLATVTVSLSLTASRMATKSVLVKNLEAVETLGSTTCICSDKTGTLTQNVMTVANIMYDFDIFGCETILSDDCEYDLNSESCKRLIRCATICNNAVFEGKTAKDGTPKPFKQKRTLGDGSVLTEIQWKTNGDASESAMIKFVQNKPMYNDACSTYVQNQTNKKEVGGITDTRLAFPTIGPEEKKWEIPFNSKNKYQVSVHLECNDKENSTPLLAMKGAPERILARCSHVMMKGECVELTDETRQQVTKLNSKLARMGRRVLAFCEKELPEKYGVDFDFNTEIVNFPIGEDAAAVEAEIAERKAAGAPDDELPSMDSTEKLTFLGLMALIDPPRPSVPDAVGKCKTAGIKVIMVTGDHPETARAIAREVGIIWGDTGEDVEERNEEKGLKEGDANWEDPDLAPAIVVPGWTIAHDTPINVWDDILDHGQIVFARTSPQQKLIIVEQCKRRKEIVAVTGDGVNDAPALKAANIGVAMGIMGSDVSKEAADMILLDDNFASIVNGVEEGRLIFDNLKKSIAYTLSSNIPEISPFLAFITIRVPLPLSTVLILCVDLGTDMVPAISMAWENPEADIMMRNPRNAEVDRLVTKKLVVFAYLEIGVIQCLAGFYTWMVVLNDYGYAPHTLPTLGAYDNWGRQMLFCKLKKGSFKNLGGEAASGGITGDSYVTAIHAAMSQGYIFWDKGTDGEITSCHFASKNYYGSSEQSSFSLKTLLEGGYPGFTSGSYQPTLQSIRAMHNAGYVEYLPFRGRRSAWFDKAWLTWDPMKDSGSQSISPYVPGAGAEVLADVHFAYQPMGIYDLASPGQAWVDTASKSDDWAYVTAGVVEFTKDETVSGSVTMGETLFKSPDKLTTTLFANSTDTATFGPEMVASLYSWKDGSNVRTNVAGRMMQKEALHHAQCASFICIIIVQWADLMICKTRWLSIRQQGMVNPAMNFGLLFETILGAFLCYCPGIGVALGTRPIRLTHWVPGAPWAIFIFMYDEIRKKMMRETSTEMTDEDTKKVTRDPGWLERNTYY
jgi:sodium/potassium-transporting ATPase subunit alpha